MNRLLTDNTVIIEAISGRGWLDGQNRCRALDPRWRRKPDVHPWLVRTGACCHGHPARGKPVPCRP